jgi:hypothetical protein
LVIMELSQNISSNEHVGDSRIGGVAGEDGAA